MPAADIVAHAYRVGIISKQVCRFTQKWVAQQDFSNNGLSRNYTGESCQLERLIIRAVSEKMIPVSCAAELLNASAESD